jgi:protein ImuB
MPATPLWLALHLPCLALEANAPLPSPSAVVEQGRIVLADTAAGQAGIARGIGVAAARMLAPAITLIARNTPRESAALQTLACWAGGFTPRISLTPGTLLLEIGTCLRLFGGVEKIVSAVREGVEAQGFTLALAVAPTPRGAQWLAQSGTAALCLDAGTLRQRLEALPIVVLPDKASASLARFGARTLADVRRLPSAALGRRIGVGSLQLMAQAFGEIADPRVEFAFPEQFSRSLPLPAAVETAAALLFAARRLTSALAGWLIARQAGVREMTLHLQHRQQETRLVLQFAELTADGARFERVLRERLEGLLLKAPVESLRLEATRVDALAGRSRALFNDAAAGQEAIAALLERLCARLGEQQVYRVALHDDHRPEYATRHTGLFARTAKAAPSAALPRPLWLLATPQSLAEIAGRPQRRGPLRLLAGPERIESGWWDGGEMSAAGGEEAAGDIRRDYFIALSVDACWLWIYRECREAGGWYLHGFFS